MRLSHGVSNKQTYFIPHRRMDWIYTRIALLVPPWIWHPLPVWFIACCALPGELDKWSKPNFRKYFFLPPVFLSLHRWNSGIHQYVIYVTRGKYVGFQLLFPLLKFDRCGNESPKQWCLCSINDLYITVRGTGTFCLIVRTNNRH